MQSAKALCLGLVIPGVWVALAGSRLGWSFPSWSSPSLRRIADDLVVQTARNLRALRSSSAGSSPALSPAAVGLPPAPVKAPAVSSSSWSCA